MKNIDPKVEILNLDSNFDEWDRFVENSPQGSIFAKSWWLKTVCPKKFLIFIIRDKNGIVLGYPFPIDTKFGMKISIMPRFTQTLGPILRDFSCLNETNRISLENELLNVILENFPKIFYLKHNFHFSFSNLLPFMWDGFNTSVKYTYTINNSQPIKDIYQNISSNYKNKINKARRNGLQVIESEDINVFIDVVRKSMDQKIKMDYSLIESINQVCKINNSRKIYLVKDSDDVIHSALFGVYNKNFFYNLFQGGDPELRKSGANILALWYSIENSRDYSLFYDFEGSILQNIEPVFRNMGGRQTPYFSISKSFSRNFQEGFKTQIKKLFIK